jgi:hypothetical protein
MLELWYGYYATTMIASLFIILLLVAMSVIVLLIHKACDWIEMVLINIILNNRKK